MNDPTNPSMHEVEIHPITCSCANCAKNFSKFIDELSVDQYSLVFINPDGNGDVIETNPTTVNPDTPGRIPWAGAGSYKAREAEIVLLIRRTRDETGLVVEVDVIKNQAGAKVELRNVV